MKYKHYSPKTKCILVKMDSMQIEKVNILIQQNDNCCVLGFTEDRQCINVSDELFINLGSKENLEEISSNIFSSLRKVDKLGCNLAIIEGVNEKNLGLSIMNRLIRACEYNIV